MIMAKGLVSTRVSEESFNTEECSGDDACADFGDASGLPFMNDEGGVSNGAESEDEGEFGLDGGDGGDGERCGGGDREGDE
jgi:hypothetical protein